MDRCGTKDNQDHCTTSAESAWADPTPRHGGEARNKVAAAVGIGHTKPGLGCADSREDRDRLEDKCKAIMEAGKVWAIGHVLTMKDLASNSGRRHSLILIARQWCQLLEDGQVTINA